MAKAALGMLGLPGGTRLPLVDATPAELEQLRADLVGRRRQAAGTVHDARRPGGRAAW